MPLTAEERMRTEGTSSEVRDELALRAKTLGSEKGEDPLTPLVPEELWPGEPTSQVPPIYGPAGGQQGVPLPVPLFSFEQLKTLQEMYGAAPQLYGTGGSPEVARPRFLEDEETTLRTRLCL